MGGLARNDGSMSTHSLEFNNLFTDIRQDVGHRSKRDLFDQSASRKHFITKQNISNVRVNIKDNAIIRHKSDPLHYKTWWTPTMLIY